MTATPVKKVFAKPSHPDGHKYNFNCCPSPDVWEYDDGIERCRVCGHDWSEALGDN